MKNIMQAALPSYKISVDYYERKYIKGNNQCFTTQKFVLVPM